MENTILENMEQQARKNNQIYLLPFFLGRGYQYAVYIYTIICDFFTYHISKAFSVFWKNLEKYWMNVQHSIVVIPALN